MADGRVIAHGAGDTASGAFTCVVRRAELPNRLCYRVHFENNSDGRADIVFLRGDDAVQRMLVPARSHADFEFTLPVDFAGAPIVLEIACDGSAMRVLEQQRPSEAPATRRLLVMAVIAAAATGAVVAAVTLVLWTVLRRRRPPPALDPEPPPPTVDPEPPTESHVAIVPEPASPQPAEEAATVFPAAVQLLGPEVVRHRAEHATAGVTYEARPVGERASLRSVMPVVIGLAVIVAAFVIGHPHVGDLGAPNEVMQGSALDVPYAASGLGTLRYRLSSSSGVVLAENNLAAHTGTLHISIPSGRQDETYRLQLMLNGPLGDASNEATISARAVPHAQIITRVPVVPNIRSFAVTRSTANNASSIVVFYDVLADRGTVSLIDSRGIQYGVTALNASGQARFPLPGGVDPGTLAVDLHAVRGGVAADSRIALPTGQNGTLVAAWPSSNSAPADTETTPIVVPATSIGAAPIRVRIVHHYQDLYLALIDGNAHKIAGAAVPRTSGVIALAHPPVDVATRVTVEATYRVNNESDTVIRPVILIPAGG